MTIKAQFLQPGEMIDWTADADYAAGDVIQLPDGRAAVVSVSVLSGFKVGVFIDGIFTVQKTTTMVILDGGKVFWDDSAAKSHYKKVNDRDFYFGRAIGDAASADTSHAVELNSHPPADVSLLRDGVLSVPTGTAAFGGFGLPIVYGGSRAMTLTATNEAQCIDMLSVDRWDKNANAIAEFVIRLAANGSTNAVDLSLGIANGTSTTDADAITEHVLFHVDGNDLSIFCQSKDGTTTVAAADSTIDLTAGTAVANRFELWIDTRDTSNVKLYVNGVRVLSGSTFKINAATGPFGLLAHVEKSSSTATFGPIYIERAEARFAKA